VPASLRVLAVKAIIDMNRYQNISSAVGSCRDALRITVGNVLFISGHCKSLRGMSFVLLLGLEALGGLDVRSSAYLSVTVSTMNIVRT
jgi:hypothetical protein